MLQHPLPESPQVLVNRSANGAHRRETMKTLKTAIFALTAGALLAGVYTGLGRASSVQAQAVASDGSASIVCAAAPGNWTDCSVTLRHSVPAGGTVAVELASRNAAVGFCTDGTASLISTDDSTVSYSDCAISGNAAVLYCDQGCGAGKQFTVSAVGESSAALAQSFSVISTAMPSANPSLLGPLPPAG
jgi:hypothetical protein